MRKKIIVLIPVYNEEENIPIITSALRSILENQPYTYQLLFVNDGSSDQSLSVIREQAAKYSEIRYISFSRNFGKDNAILAGFHAADGDAVITIDADMQHPPEKIPEMIGLWEAGNDVIYNYRSAEGNEHVSNFNQFTSRLFYKIINKLSDVELENGISDFTLLDKKVVAVLSSLLEDNPFFRGLIKWVGFQQIGIPYTPNQRKSGTSKYNNKLLMKLALQGITSFSVKPLLIAIYLGLIFSILSLLYIPYVLYSLYHHLAISGWASTIVTIAFFGGLESMILGILGIYLGKLFIQSKQRPNFIIKESNITQHPWENRKE